MKKISYLLVGLTTMLFCTNSVNAMTTNSDGSMINKRGVTITQKQYEKLAEIFAESENKEKKIDYLEQEEVNAYTNSDREFKIQKEHFITTYTLNRYGNVINTITVPASEEDAEKVAENKNLHLMANGTLQDVSKMISTRGVIDGSSYETASKSLELHYNGEYASMYVDWKTIPKVKSFDVLAFRGTNFKDNVRSYTAYQLSDDPNQGDGTFYDKNGTNTKISSNGIGVSMNLHDNPAEPYTLHLWIGGYGKPAYGDYIYATYQHAVNNISLATSQSYTFGSSGLGGVLVYSNGYSKYFDNMTGLKLHYS